MQELYLTNEGDTTFEHADLVVTGPDSAQFIVVPSHVHYTEPGDSILVRVYFSPNFEGNYTAVLDVGPHYSATPRVYADITAMAYNGEPSLQQIFDWKLGTNAVQTGDDDIFSTIIHDDPNTRQGLIGDEVTGDVFAAADTNAAVTVEAFSFFGPAASPINVAVSWHPWLTPNSANEILSIDQNPAVSGFEPVGDGSLAFTPGGQDFGFSTLFPGAGNAIAYSIDSLNVGSTEPKVRTYPVPGESNAYFLAVESGNAEGYQDLVFIARNLMPTTVSYPGDSTTTPVDTTTTPVDTTTNTLDSALVIYRLNAGGNVLPAVDGGMDWAKDTRWSPSVYLVSDASGHRARNSIKSGYTSAVDQTTTNLDIFTYERWDRSGGDNIQYSFPVPISGEYEVRLYFAESNVNAIIGTRTFTVNIEGAAPASLSNIDLVAEAGIMTGTMKSHVLNVTDGAIDIEFLWGASNPMINGIEILRSTASNARYGKLINSAQVPEVLLQPNPVRRGGKLQASLELVAPSPVTTRIFDTTGRLLQSKKGNARGSAFTQTLTFGDYPAGIYLVQFEGNGWLVTKRVQVTE